MEWKYLLFLRRHRFYFWNRLKMQKRNFKTRSYEDYSIPKQWDCPLIVQDMDKIINCTGCWKKVTFWECYTSRQIHSQNWFWYPVCERCYGKENKECWC